MKELQRINYILYGFSFDYISNIIIFRISSQVSITDGIKVQCFIHHFTKVPHSFKELGINEDEFKNKIEKVLQFTLTDLSTRTCPRKTTEDELKKHLHEKIVDVILKVRQGKLEVKPGYDGEYGVPVIEKVRKQHTLKEF